MEDAGGLADGKPVSLTELHDSSPPSPNNPSPSLPMLLPAADGNDHNDLDRPEPYGMSPLGSSPIIHAAGQQPNVASPVNEALSETESSSCTMPGVSQNKQLQGRADVQRQRPSHLGKRSLEAAELQVRPANCTVHALELLWNQSPGI